MRLLYGTGRTPCGHALVATALHDACACVHMCVYVCSCVCMHFFPFRGVAPSGFWPLLSVLLSVLLLLLVICGHAVRLCTFAVGIFFSCTSFSLLRAVPAWWCPNRQPHPGYHLRQLPEAARRCVRTGRVLQASRLSCTRAFTAWQYRSCCVRLCLYSCVRVSVLCVCVFELLLPSLLLLMHLQRSWRRCCAPSARPAA